MKFILKYTDFITEKVDVDKYLHQIKDVEKGNLPPEIKAFLDIIAYAEGTIKYPENGYKTQFTGKQFSDYSDHPREVIKSGGYNSSASGRYQFLSKTWDGLMKGKEFSPINQDEGAVKLLKQNKAYSYVLKGDLKKGLYRVRNIWASLPWSKYGQPAWYANSDEEKFQSLTELYYKRLKHYNPSATIPDNITDLDSDVSGFSSEESSRIGKRKRGSGGYSNGDSFPFIVGSSSGDNIKKLQRSIIKLGGSLPIYGIDGLFGTETMGASKFVLTNLAEITNKNIDGIITDSLSENHIKVIVNASENEKYVSDMIKKFGMSNYKTYSQNLPLVNGEIIKGGDIYNVESLSKTINKIKGKENINIYHIGDSHIKASWLTDTIKNGLSEMTTVNYSKNAENGWTVDKHLKNKSKIKSDIDNSIDLVIISLGANDSNISPEKFNPNRFKNSYNELINYIKSINENVEILLITPTPSLLSRTKKPNPNKNLTQSVIYDISATNNVAVWDIFKKMGGTDGIEKLMNDGFIKDGEHFTRNGYTRMGKELVSDIKKYINK
jgi:muramidase (phage lysozyme)/lysophospholipase L1-like esterase